MSDKKNETTNEINLTGEEIISEEKKKNCVEENSKIPETTQKLIQESKFLYSRSKYVFDFALHTWYEELKQWTPLTAFIPLSIDDIKGLYHYCDAFFEKKTIDETTSIRLKEIMNRVDVSIKEVQIKNSKKRKEEKSDDSDDNEEDYGAFLKLSTRSPKDAVNGIVNDRMKTILIKELELYSDGSPNQDCVCFVSATRKCFKVKSAVEGFELIQRSSRIREDLMKALEFPEAFRLDLLIRQWRPMEPSMEFRGFVYNKKLNALSQYCYLQYFPELSNPTNLKKIEMHIKELWDKIIAPRIKHDHCIVDFAVLTNSLNNSLNQKKERKDIILEIEEVLVIELNPFFSDTGACMFSWKSQEDKKIIKEGPFEFRVRKEPLTDPYSCLPTPWKDYFCSLRNISSTPILPSLGKESEKSYCSIS